MSEIKIQYASDLHLEFDVNNFWLQQNPLLPVADILVLAGDISYLRDDFYKNPFFNYASENWEAVYWLPGNHEYYCGIDIKNYDFSTPVAIRKNVFLVNDISIEYKGIYLIFSTLWSKIENHFASFIERNVSDFECIVYNNEKLSVKTFNQLYQQSLFFFKTELKRLEKKEKIIISHHLLSNQCNATEFLGSKLNSAFCTELTDFVKTSNALAWIYGHSHRNMPEIEIGKTKMLTNQLGYLQLYENKGFSRSKVVTPELFGI